MSAPGSRPARVRPYAITGGRTRTRVALALETLVHTDGAAELRTLSGERRTICELCLRPISVAEVSARAALPLGVVRVLLDDMAGAGLVVLHGATADRPDRALLERVLDGLQRL
ncbi:hypothetical protein Acsp06_52060 [Actinomycetospora sp. NBRC 106375]|uniref:DUF742 domain-containing protein n=1 Tax=Actinomycetospora sp. NBRC 106375 TaxID=3032207 RepID=UPI0024A3E52F|nr:DUF742 domain-containing protein [Actinomycetospora sp. NBRC 106375]GLZ49021.1 hypothetical protein Acsp06_52060 [Actinomycetospora sp. NBRC 106375]